MRTFGRRDGGDGGDDDGGGAAAAAPGEKPAGFFDGLFGGKRDKESAAEAAALDSRLSEFDSFVPSPAWLRARNRWQLARMLLANPCLRHYRYHRLSSYDLPPVNNPYARFRQKLASRLSETDRSLAQTRDGCVPALKALPATLKGLPRKAQEGGRALADKARACPAPAMRAASETADELKARARAVPPAAKEAADVTVTVTKAAVDELAGAAKQGVADAKSLLERTKKQE